MACNPHNQEEYMQRGPIATLSLVAVMMMFGWQLTQIRPFREPTRFREVKQESTEQRIDIPVPFTVIDSIPSNAPPQEKIYNIQLDQETDSPLSDVRLFFGHIQGSDELVQILIPSHCYPRAGETIAATRQRPSSKDNETVYAMKYDDVLCDDVQPQSNKPRPSGRGLIFLQTIQPLL